MSQNVGQNVQSYKQAQQTLICNCNFYQNVDFF